MEKKLFLLDGHALVYRAHYAFISRPLINSKGINTGAITGFVRTLWDLIKNQNPSHLAVSFDLRAPTFRHEVFPDYKANRESQPEDITIAMPYIQKIIKAFNIPVVTMQGYEADDVIGTLSKQAEKEGFKVYMVTPDKDYGQLVSENIFMYKPARSGGGIDILGVPEILEKWDIESVDQVIDVLSLQGDSVDNIPGIPSIGAKTAVKLLKEYKSLEGILENTDKLKGKQKENVENFADQGRMSKFLATIKLDVPIQFDAEKYKIEEIDRDALSPLFKELEFRTLAQQVLGESKEGEQQSLFKVDILSKTKNTNEPKEYSIGKNNIENTPHDYKLIDTPNKRKGLIKILSKENVISFDTETTGLDAHQAELVGIAFSIKKNEGYYVPVPDDPAKAKAIVAEFKDILEDDSKTKIGQNIKYDITILKWCGVNVAGPFKDTMIMHYLSEPDLRHKLDYLTESYLDYKMVPIEALIGKRGKNQLSMRDIAVEKVSEYAAEDADLTLQICEEMEKLLSENHSEKVFNEIEEPLIIVLADMEYEGVRINPDFLNDYSKVLAKSILKREKEIYKKAGVPFNISSPRQVGQVLFEKLKIPYRWRKTSSGQYSTDVTKLNELAHNHEIVDDILDYRKLTKLKSTYVDSLPLLVNPRTGRVHSNFNQARAATGRLSSENPNLQNIPIKNDEGREIRKAFEPRNKDHILLAADYSQIELRVIASISNDAAMMDAFIKGNDFHRATAAKVYNVDYDAVTDDQRRNAKTVNFSITYGAGATNLSRQLSIKRSEAQELIAQYFIQYAGLKSYMDNIVNFARENGYVETLGGRRRTLRDINSKNGLIRSNAERIAINTPIQGTAADLIKIAMINIHREFKEQKIQSKMIMQVHDELVFDVIKPELDAVKGIVEEKMKNAMPAIKVPLVIGIGTGENWLEAH